MTGESLDGGVGILSLLAFDVLADPLGVSEFAGPNAYTWRTEGRSLLGSDCLPLSIGLLTRMAKFLGRGDSVRLGAVQGREALSGACASPEEEDGEVWEMLWSAVQPASARDC